MKTYAVYKPLLFRIIDSFLSKKPIEQPVGTIHRCKSLKSPIMSLSKTMFERIASNMISANARKSLVLIRNTDKPVS